MLARSPPRRIIAFHDPLALIDHVIERVIDADNIGKPYYQLRADLIVLRAGMVAEYDSAVFEDELDYEALFAGPSLDDIATHAAADQAAADLGVEFPEDVKKVVDKIAFLKAAEFGEPTVEEPAEDDAGVAPLGV